MEFFENTVNPKRTRGTIVQQLLETQYKIRHDRDKYTKVNTTHMVPAIATDNPEDPKDLDPTKVKLRRTQGQLRNPKRHLRTASAALV